MEKRKLIRLMVLALAVAMLVALPLAGCGGGADEPAEDEGSGDSGGDDGDTGSGDGDTGSGDGATEWRAWQFAAGQSFKYEFDIVSDGENQGGWYSMAFTDAGGGNLNLAYEGSFGGNDFSGTVVVSAENPVDDLMGGNLHPFAMLCFLPMFTLDWGALAEEEWAVGNSWSWSGPEGEVSYEVTGTETYAGLEGYAIEWRLDGELITKVVVSRAASICLYMWMGEDDQNRFEYTLLECEGF